MCFWLYKNEKSKLQNSLELLKNHLICFKYNIFCFHKFFKKFSWIYKDGKPGYKNEYIAREKILIIIVSKDETEKLEEQEMKKLKSIKQDEMGEKPKLIRDKLKDIKINDIWTIFETEKEKEDRKKKEAKWKNN